MKKLFSFRLSQTARQNLQALAEKHKMSQAEIIEAMSAIFANPDNEHLDIHIRAEKIKNSKQYKKLVDEYGETIKELGIKF